MTNAKFLIVATRRILGVFTGLHPVDERACLAALQQVPQKHDNSEYSHIGYVNRGIEHPMGRQVWTVQITERGGGEDKLFLSSPSEVPRILANLPPSVLFVARDHSMNFERACDDIGIDFQTVACYEEVAVTVVDRPRIRA